MEWNNLQKALQEYTSFLLEATKNNMPEYYALRDRISFTISIDNAFYCIDFNAPAYWKWAENGRGPGKMPPINVIEDWITRRKITPRSNTKTPMSTRSLAFLIARKIGREGTEGSHFLSMTLSEQENYFTDKIINAITDDIMAQLDEYFKPNPFKIEI